MFSPHSGMFPCFFGGSLTLLFSKASRAMTIFALVSAGSMTSSMYPLAAATYGFANFSLYSCIFCLLNSSGFSAFAISFLNIIFAAPSGPITAISAVGHAKTKSAPKCLLPMAK
ncbi:113aa long hypothetical protein [Pyrococcus horikoshii OT3]|uniref:Uncharacterized protein n=1 Tax=Pyrococcus horikoshii (strain ATCC 700860 / DSM 12428 / JCM 9974 / NBRC 100139 / OT-3) TaxID=70601 RepID=O59019_PYRHO|nr:113aa long hypothetical protein [Pyrococcus horikoshii OT3]